MTISRGCYNFFSEVCSIVCCVQSNLFFLDELGKPTVLRCPIIPGYNDRPAHFAGIAAVANRMKNLCGIEIEPYHSLGDGKYDSLDRGNRGFLRPDAEPDPESWCRQICSATCVKVSQA